MCLPGAFVDICPHKNDESKIQVQMIEGWAGDNNKIHSLGILFFYWRKAVNHTHDDKFLTIEIYIKTKRLVFARGPTFLA